MKNKIKKEYQLKTIREIFDVINEKNIDGFITDFSMWLKLSLKLNNLDTKEIKVLPDVEIFRWNDDGKWGEIDKVDIKIHTKNNLCPPKNTT